jgi:hypothetical protein
MIASTATKKRRLDARHQETGERRMAKAPPSAKRDRTMLVEDGNGA